MKSERGCFIESGGVRGGVVAVGEAGAVGAVVVDGDGDFLELVTLVEEEALDDVEEKEDAVDVEKEDGVDAENEDEDDEKEDMEDKKSEPLWEDVDVESRGAGALDRMSTVRRGVAGAVGGGVGSWTTDVDDAGEVSSRR